MTGTFDDIIAQAMGDRFIGDAKSPFERPVLKTTYGNDDPAALERLTGTQPIATQKVEGWVEPTRGEISSAAQAVEKPKETTKPTVPPQVSPPPPAPRQEQEEDLFAELANDMSGGALDSDWVQPLTGSPTLSSPTPAAPSTAKKSSNLNNVGSGIVGGEADEYNPYDDRLLG